MQSRLQPHLNIRHARALHIPCCIRPSNRLWLFACCDVDLCLQDAYGRQLLGELLAKVLQYVPQEQRLSSCALVSRSWHTTALAATSSVSISSCMKLPAFQRYVSKHGNLLSSVCITNGYYWADASEALCIPFEQLEKLQSLQLTRVGILQGESGHKQQRAGWSCLTALSSLHLQRVVWQPPQPFAELSTLTCLKDLYLDLTDVTYHEDMRECINTAMACLTQLTNLGLKFKAMEDKDMTNLANLMHLRNWYLGNGRVTANALQVVPPSVTSLELFAMGDWRLDPVATPHVPLLTNLRTLDVQCVSHWDPNILLDMPRLSRLLLNRVNMLQQGDASTPQGGLKTLLAVLQKLTNLEHLVILEEQQKDKPYTEASLVLNTGLTHLDLTCSSVLWECIKRGMFRNNLQLQMLQFLKLGLGYAEKHLQPIESTGDLQNIVHGCPMLQELWLVGAWNPDHVDVQLTPLKQLSGLTQLAIGGYKLETSWLEGTITDMVRWTRLKDLCFRDVDDLGEVMLGLRRLTQLTSLEFSSGCYITPDETERDKEIAIERHIISRVSRLVCCILFFKTYYGSKPLEMALVNTCTHTWLQ